MSFWVAFQLVCIFMGLMACVTFFFGGSGRVVDHVLELEIPEWMQGLFLLLTFFMQIAAGVIAIWAAYSITSLAPSLFV